MPEPFVYEQSAVRVVSGAGSIADVPDELDRLGVRRALMLVGASGRGDGERLEMALGARVVGRVDSVRRHVPLAQAQAGRRQAEDVDADGLVCLGGGSATGAAKAIALCSGLPILAIPTTYAGSEMTPIWGMTVDGDKRTGIDPAVQPRTVVYDPELSRRVPLPITAASVANALAHCVEGTWTPRANVLTDVSAVEGARLLHNGLRRVLDAPEDLAARSDLLHGACLAGMVLAGAGTGLHHKLCHLLGGAFDLPHAETHAAVLPHVAALNADSAPRARDNLASAIGADDLAGGLFDMFAASGAPTSLRELGLEEAQARATAARLAFATRADLAAVDEQALEKLLLRAWAGERPEGRR
ncbi:maleylacetate reductase [Nocardia testacea]|uniref:maleylacetate reductase n=1 Tax=Nocardia testacea TaxID=248551 RepID=UPI003A86387F